MGGGVVKALKEASPDELKLALETLSPEEKAKLRGALPTGLSPSTVEAELIPISILYEEIVFKNVHVCLVPNFCMAIDSRTPLYRRSSAKKIVD